MRATSIPISIQPPSTPIILHAIMHHLYRIITWWCLYKQLDPPLVLPGIHNLLSHDPHAFKDSKVDKIRNKAHVEEPFRRLEKLYIHMYVDHASAQYPKHVANNL